MGRVQGGDIAGVGIALEGHLGVGGGRTVISSLDCSCGAVSN